MGAHALYLVRMDVAHDHEATFNEVYDLEHVPNLRAVPGVRRASRYRQLSPTEPRYLAAYELDGLNVLDSAAWKTAGEAGARPPRVGTHTMNPHPTQDKVGGRRAGTAPGGGAGIGAATARRVAGEGAAVVVADLSGTRAEGVASAIATGGGRAAAIKMDASDRRAVQRTRRLALDTFGRLDVMV